MPCPTCSKIYPTANKFLKHECFIKASVDQQKEQLALFHREIEEEFDLRPRNHHKTRRSSSLHPVKSIVLTVTPPPTSVEVTVYREVSNAPLLHTSGLLVLHKSNYLDASAGVYNNS